MEKDFVGIGFSICPVCGAEHDEIVLVNMKLHRPTLKKRQAIGWGMCKKDMDLFNDGYVALVECTNQPTTFEDAYRTGRVMHIRKTLWPHIFNVPVPEKGICFVDIEVIDKLEAVREQQSGEQPS